MEIALPARRSSWRWSARCTPLPTRPAIAEPRIEAGDEDVDPHALFEQVTVDKARLARHIRHALQGPRPGHALLHWSPRSRWSRASPS